MNKEKTHGFWGKVTFLETAYDVVVDRLTYWRYKWYGRKIKKLEKKLFNNA